MLIPLLDYKLPGDMIHVIILGSSILTTKLSALPIAERQTMVFAKEGVQRGIVPYRQNMKN